MADWLLYGGALYTAICSLLATVIAVALWLPFSLL
jgi:hypothetical protein